MGVSEHTWYRIARWIDTYLPNWWYVSHSDALTCESTVSRPGPNHPASLIHTTYPISLFIMHGMSANWIHSPSNPQWLATCLWPPVSLITHWSDTQVNIRRYPRAPNEGEHSNEQRATSSEPRAPERAYANHERLDTQSRLWVYDWYMKLSFFVSIQIIMWV